VDAGESCLAVLTVLKCGRVTCRLPPASRAPRCQLSCLLLQSRLRCNATTRWDGDQAGLSVTVSCLETALLLLAQWRDWMLLLLSLVRLHADCSSYAKVADAPVHTRGTCGVDQSPTAGC
jgi:hypothetical protein